MKNQGHLTNDALNMVLKEYKRTVIIESFIEQFNELLDENKISNLDLSNAIGVSDSYISQVRRYKKTPNLDFIAKLSLALGVDVSVSLLNPKCDTKWFSNFEFSIPNQFHIDMSRFSGQTGSKTSFEIPKTSVNEEIKETLSFFAA